LRVHHKDAASMKNVVGNRRIGFRIAAARFDPSSLP